MPASFLSAAERERLNSFRGEIGELDLATYFTLTAEDRALIEQRRRPANRLGFALQLCTLRHLGFVPDDLRRAPHAALVTQVGMESCPGYRAHRVTERPSRWLLLAIPSHMTCAHLRVQATERGLVAACPHPLGQATAWWDAA